jgi:hypothetical protein
MKTHSFLLFFLLLHTLELAPILEHRAEFPQFLDQGQSVGLLGRVISSSQGIYLYTGQHGHRKTRTHTHTANIDALSGIRTHDPGFRASEDSWCLRSLDYRDRHEDVWGSGNIVPTFLNDAINGGEWSASRPRQLYPRGKSPRYQFDSRLSGPQNRSGRCGIEKNFLALPKSNPGRPAGSVSLYRLRYPGSLIYYIQAYIFICLFAYLLFIRG